MVAYKRGNFNADLKYSIFMINHQMIWLQSVKQVYISRELKISKYIPNTSEVSSFLTNLAKSTVFGAGLVLFTKKDHYVKK